MDAFPTFRIFFLALLSLVFTHTAFAGYLGGSYSFTTTAIFDDQDDGFRIDVGSDVSPWLDLEWSYVDFGQSSFDDPSFVLGDILDDDDNDRFENSNFGSQSVNEQRARFTGISHLNTQALSAGLKFKKPINNWLQLFARISFMAWHSESVELRIYAPRDPYDIDGNIITDPNDIPNANNLNECGTVSYCRIEDTDNPKDTWAVDFWYGYGAIFKPYNWLAIRTEYSIVTLNAVDFPKASLEGFSAGLEIYY